MITIDPGKFTHSNLKLSDYVDEINYIKLSSDVIFGSIYNVELSNEFVFVGTDQGLLVFDYSGDYIKKIGGIGNGPSEYNNSIDFTTDNQTKRIYLRDFPYIKIFSFEGEYMGSIKTEGGHIKTIYREGNLFLIPLVAASRQKIPHLWTVIDLNGNVLFEKENTEIHFEGEGFNYRGNYAYRNSDFVGYWNHYSDTIYRISDRNNLPHFVWSKGSYRLTTEKNIIERDANCIRMHTVFETKNILYIYYKKDTKSYICIYDKVNGLFLNEEMGSSIKAGIHNDIDGGIPFLPQYLASINQDDYFIESVYPEEVTEQGSAGELKDISPDDNQILVLTKLKK
ncbi:6-bladed beta-propeller [Parabacteroides sp. OttesenSCG-928-J18]|nr:6-bladed beta-propeller [Parabacteroides sp. OttesenSCG-928-J18]